MMFLRPLRIHFAAYASSGRLLRTLSFSAVLILTGCVSKVAKLPKEAEVDVPGQWQTSTSQDSDKSATEAREPEFKSVKNGWLNNFADNDLNTHVQTALRNNPDLWSSAAQLKSAIEQVTVTGSALWPSVRASLNSNRIDNDTGAVTTGVSSGGGATFTNGVGVNNTTTITTEIRTVSATLDISWEADVWGKLTQRKRAEAYNAKAQAEIYKAAELSLVANVSRAWYILISNKLQLDLAHQRLESFKRTAALIEENYERGLRSALDVYLSRTDVQLQISALSDSQFDYIQSLRAFKTLLGEYPNTSLEFAAKLPELQDPVPAGLPAELLTRRPDLKASQLQYKAQIANAKAARRDRYPSINFSGSIGDSRERFDELFDNNNMILTLVSGLTQPVFQSGALRSREDQAIFRAEGAYATLVKTTLNAFEEVENSLSREALLLEQHRAIKEAVEFAQGGLDLALDRYQSGIENYTTVLESQRRLFDSMRNEINIRNALVQNRIGIHLALGGDFTDIPDRTPTNDLPTINAKGKDKQTNESE